MEFFLILYNIIPFTEKRIIFIITSKIKLIIYLLLYKFLKKDIIFHFYRSFIMLQSNFVAIQMTRLSPVIVRLIKRIIKLQNFF